MVSFWIFIIDSSANCFFDLTIPNSNKIQFKNIVKKNKQQILMLEKLKQYFFLFDSDLNH